VNTLKNAESSMKDSRQPTAKVPTVCIYLGIW